LPGQYLACRKGTNVEVNWQDYLPLVKAMARRYQGPGLEQADLEQEGWLALLEASRRFDPQREVPRAAYYRLSIRSALRQLLRRYSRDALSRACSADTCTIQPMAEDEVPMVTVSLSLRQSQVLRAWLREGSIQQAAKSLGLPLGTAKTHLRRGLKHLGKETPAKCPAGHIPRAGRSPGHIL
jgi:RNA polymerase sigma factor (sigma-70 family)